MKKFLTLFFVVGMAAKAEANIIFDADGFFPVVVQVVQKDTGQPIADAQVQLEGVGEYHELDLDPRRQRKVYKEDLGKPLATDFRGIAVVTYYTRYGGSVEDGKSVVSLPMKGTVTVKLQGKEVYRKALGDWAKEAGYEASTDSAPRIIVEVDGKTEK